jgi:hypothetical protein
MIARRNTGSTVSGPATVGALYRECRKRRTRRVVRRVPDEVNAAGSYIPISGKIPRTSVWTFA